MRIWVLLAALGCGGALADRSRPAVVRDSAGIAIVENVDPARPDGEWSIDSAIAVRIGGSDDARDDERYEFHIVKGVARMRNGDLLVADWGSTQVRVFDSTGSFVRVLVKKGAGPGELHTVSEMYHTRDDTIVVYNGEGAALAVFGPDLRLARTVLPVEFRADSLRRPHSSPGIHAVFDDGSVLGSTSYESGFDWRTDKPGQPHRAYADSMFLARGTAGDRQLSEFGWFIERRGFYAMVARGSYHGHNWFRPQGMFGVRATDLYYVDGGRAEVRVYGGDGRLRRLIRASRQPAAVDASDADAQRNAYANAQRPAIPDYVAPPALPAAPSHHPVLDAMIVDVNGNVWVRSLESTAPTRRSIWLVFDSAGVLTHHVPDRTRMNVMEIGADYMLGVTRDSLGVESVIMQRVVKRGN